MFLKNLAEKFWDQKYSLALLFVWSGLFFVSAFWNLHENYQGTYTKALIEAKTIFQHNLAYRRWNTMHGGVYAKVTGLNQPNPYIITEDRDFKAEDGTDLTLINPFRMTKQAYDLLKKQSPELAVFNRTVSLAPLNSENAPDPWEEKALLGFEEGKREIHEITTIDDAQYMRLMMPYITEEKCLRCHEHQGYEVGDIRGGMSISVPMKPYYLAAATTRKTIVITHMFLWLLGTATIILFFAGLKKYQNTIKENEKKFRIVSEFAYNFEYWVNEKKEMAFISPSCERVTGYSRKEFLQKSQLMFDLVHPDDKGIFRNHLSEFDEPVHKDLEYRIITKDGTVRWLSHTCSPIYVKGQFLGRRGSNRDITVNKQLEEELQQAKKIEDLGHFAGIIAHDFNNVLTSITSITQLLNGKIDKNNTSQKEYVNYILIAAKLGQNLTSNLLLFGRRQTSNPQKIKLNAIISNIAQVIESLLPEGIKLSILLADGEKDVMGDPHQIEQILINLATNARDAMSGIGDLSIATSVITLTRKQAGKFGDIEPGDYMLLTVSDTGSGIAEDGLSTIFEPFFSTKGSGKGTGLGLSIVDNIVKQHRAYIDVDSALQQGTSFRIFFPAVMETGEGHQLPSSLEECREEGNKTILVVDDEWLIRKALLICLQSEGYNVLLAADGEEAIRQYKKHGDTIDLIVLDVMLPHKDGREVYDILKKENQELRVLFISGLSEKNLAEKQIVRGELDFLAKPLDFKEFAGKIDEMLNR